MDIEINGSQVVRCSKCGSPMFSAKECETCKNRAILNEKSDEELCDMVCDAHQEAAEEINEEGRKAQIAYLLWEACWSPE